MRRSHWPYGILVATLFLAGCGGGVEDAAPAPEAESAETETGTTVEKTYVLRGEVTALPEGEDTRIRVHHEAIPDFEVNGEVVGMDAMTMAFQPAEGVSLDGLEVGSKVTFDWRISDAAPYGEVVRIEILPGDAVLDFGAPEGDDEAPAEEGHDH